MPEVSVIIPVYMVEQTLRRCVDSVLSQTFTDYEVILVDDGSPDSCGDICNDYSRGRDNVKVIHQKNGGLSAARNAGLTLARGEYVMFLDSDDYLCDDCLETLHGKDADLVIGSIVYTYENGKTICQPDCADEQIEKQDYKEKLPVLLHDRRLNYVHAKLYRHTVIKTHGLVFEDDMLTSAEDTVFNFTFLKYCDRIYVSSKPVHHYVYQKSGLGKRFYPDRYDRFLRLNGFIEKTCREIGVFSDEMDEEINRRRIQSAVWTLSGIMEQKDLPRKTKRVCLAQIYSDDLLNRIVTKIPVNGTAELLLLLEKGPDRYLSHHALLRGKASLSRCVPRPVKQLLRKLKS